MTLQRALSTVKRLSEEATPGPWWANRVAASAGQTIRGSFNRPLARLSPDDLDSLGIPGTEGAERARTAIEQTARNAALIASAPDLAASVVEMSDLLRRLREWDMLNTYIGGDGERHEPTADAPYWRNQLDAALASFAARFGGEPGTTGDYEALEPSGDTGLNR